MYGLGHEKMAITQWKAMFIICGALTVFVGISFFFLMPAGPETAWFLNPQERLIATKRMQAESEGGDQTDFSIPQLKECVMDIRAYLSFLFGVLITLPAPVIGVSLRSFFHRSGFCAIVDSIWMAVCFTYYILSRVLGF